MEIKRWHSRKQGGRTDFRNVLPQKPTVSFAMGEAAGMGRSLKCSQSREREARVLNLFQTKQIGESASDSYIRVS